jgi:hypothetical protein
MSGMFSSIMSPVACSSRELAPNTAWDIAVLSRKSWIPSVDGACPSPRISAGKKGRP